MAIIKCIKAPTPEKIDDNVMTVDKGVITFKDEDQASAYRAMNKNALEHTNERINKNIKDINKNIKNKGISFFKKFQNVLRTNKDKEHAKAYNIIKRITDSEGTNPTNANALVEAIYFPIRNNINDLKIFQDYHISNISYQIYQDNISNRKLVDEANLKGEDGNALKKESSYYFYDTWLKDNGYNNSPDNITLYEETIKKVRDDLKAKIDASPTLSEAISIKRKSDDYIQKLMVDTMMDASGIDISANYRYDDYVKAMIVDRNNAIRSKNKNEIYRWEKRYGTTADISTDVVSLQVLNYSNTFDSANKLKAMSELSKSSDISKTVKTDIYNKINDTVNAINNESTLYKKQDIQNSFNRINDFIENNKNIRQELKDNLNNKKLDTQLVENITNTLKDSAIENIEFLRSKISNPDFQAVMQNNPNLKSLYDFLENGVVNNKNDLIRDISNLSKIYAGKPDSGFSNISTANRIIQEMTEFQKGLYAEVAKDEGLTLKDIVPDGYTITNKHGMKLINKDGTPINAEDMLRTASGFANVLDSMDNGIIADNIFQASMLNIDNSFVEDLLISEDYKVFPDNIADALFQSSTDYLSPEMRKSLLIKANSMWRRNILVTAWRVPKWAVNNKLGELNMLIQVAPQAIFNYPDAFRMTTEFLRLGKASNLLFDVEGKVEYRRKQAARKGKSFNEETVRRKAEHFNKKFGMYEGIAKSHYAKMSSEIAFLQKDLKMSTDTKEITDIKSKYTQAEMNELGNNKGQSNVYKAMNLLSKGWKTQAKWGKTAFEWAEFSPRLAMAMHAQKSMTKNETNFDNYGAADRNVIKSLLKDGNINDAAVVWANQNYIDYSDTPHFIKKINATALPFINFTYHSVGRLVRSEINYLQAIKESYGNKNSGQLIKNVGKMAYGNVIMMGAAATAWNMALKLAGLFNEDEDPVPSYISDKFSWAKILGFDNYIYIPGFGYNAKHHIYDSALEFMPFGRDTNPLSHLGLTLAGRSYAQTKAPFEMGLGVNFIGGGMQRVSPDVSPWRHSYDKLEAYIGAPVASINSAKRTVGSWMGNNSEEVTQADMWDKSRKMKYDFNGGFDLQMVGYGTTADKMKYSIKSAWKVADYDKANSELIQYIRYLESEGDDLDTIKKKITSLIDSQSILSGLSADEKEEFISGMSDKQIEIFLTGMAYEQEFRQRYGRS